MLLKSILEDCGLVITRYERLHDGDINHSYCLYGSDAKYFLKINDAKQYPNMFENEMNGLKTLADELMLLELPTLIVPRIIKSGIVKQEQFLLLEWIEPGKQRKDFWERFGEGLALLHQKEQPYFGWEENNYIGSLHQCNTKHQSWHLFYAECRIMPLIKILFDSEVFSKHDITIAESFCKRLELLFPQEPPALLHGDLWSGNFMITAAGDAAIFDPAVYYGHREMDIGMTKLFGGFDLRFYDAYN
ncbi:MAG: fructosamine kinase family protein, partial [Chitinophagaceae bacterium]